MQPERDLAAFDARATTYERGWLGRLHHDIDDRTADLVRRRGKARTMRRCDRLLHAAGFRSPAWHDAYAIIIKSVTAKA